MKIGTKISRKNHVFFARAQPVNSNAKCERRDVKSLISQSFLLENSIQLKFSFQENLSIIL